MAITVYHTVNPQDDERLERVWSVAFPAPREGRATLARTLFAEGLYEAVATVAGVDLNVAYRKTQNGVESDSWSRKPPADVTPAQPNTIVVDGGRRLGRRSSMVGDIMVIEQDGQPAAWFVVDSAGFAPMEAPHAG